MFDDAVALHRDFIIPVHAGLKAEFGIPDTPDAACLSVAIAWQESGAKARDQGDPAILGPATGKWQFEKMGGVWEVLNDAKLKPISTALCQRAGISPQPEPVWRLFASASGDELACAFARLLIWKDPAPLPAMTPGSEQAAYDYYKRRWRPGADRRTAWTESWRCGLTVVAGSGAGAAPGVEAPPAADASSIAALVADVDAAMGRLRSALRVS